MSLPQPIQPKSQSYGARLTQSPAAATRRAPLRLQKCLEPPPERRMQSCLLYRHPGRTARCSLTCRFRIGRSPCGSAGWAVRARSAVNRSGRRSSPGRPESVPSCVQVAATAPQRSARYRRVSPCGEPIICDAAHYFLRLLKRLKPKSHRNRESWRGRSGSRPPLSYLAG